MSACGTCLNRAALIASLAGRIEVLRRGQHYIRSVLELGDDALVEALGHSGGPPVLTGAAVAESASQAQLLAICQHDEDYPEILKQDRSAPSVIFLAGTLDRWRGLLGPRIADRPPTVAVVGTRKASSDGLEIARRLGRELSAAGVTVVSGMALGIDGAAHDGALAGGGRTVAVLAGSAHIPYPRRRAETHAEIAARGAVISEMPPGAASFPWTFLARNRVIAGLADATIVVEAAERSGSLVTAEMAMDLGREVGAVPGSPLNWRTAGTAELLREGALLVRDASDVLDQLLGPDRPREQAAPPVELPPAQAAMLSDIRSGFDTVSALAPRHGGAANVQAELMELELQGHAVRLTGGRIVTGGAGT